MTTYDGLLWSALGCGFALLVGIGFLAPLERNPSSFAYFVGPEKIPAHVVVVREAR